MPMRPSSTRPLAVSLTPLGETLTHPEPSIAFEIPNVVSDSARFVLVEEGRGASLTLILSCDAHELSTQVSVTNKCVPFIEWKIIGKPSVGSCHHLMQLSVTTGSPCAVRSFL